MHIYTMLLAIPTFTYGFSGHHLHQFMWANIDSFARNSERALQRYRQVAPASIWSYHGYIPFLFDHNNFSAIVGLADKIDTHFADNPHLQLLLALSFKKVNNHVEGNKRITALSAQHPTNANIILRTAQTYIELQEHHKALGVLDTYLNKSPQKTNSFLFYFLKGQIYAQLKEYTKALENIERCLELQPSYSQAWLIRAILQEQQGNIKEAIAGYSNFLALIDNSNSPIHQHLLRLGLQQSLLQKSRQIGSGSSYESHLDAAIICFTKNQYHQALIACNNYLKAHPHSVKATILKVQILVGQNNIPQAIALLCKEIEHAPDNDIWYKTLYHLKKKANGSTDFELTFKDMAKKYPTSVLAQLYAADIILRGTHPINALPYLLKAEALTAFSEQKAAILYQQALLYYDNHEASNAELVLKKIVASSPEHAPAHNLLAYVMAKKGQYKEAHRLTDKALGLDPENYHYRDTKGYVFYKEKKYAEAEKIFVEIEPKCHNDTVILSHLKKTQNKKHKNMD